MFSSVNLSKSFPVTCTVEGTPEWHPRYTYQRAHLFAMNTGCMHALVSSPKSLGRSSLHLSLEIRRFVRRSRNVSTSSLVQFLYLEIGGISSSSSSVCEVFAFLVGGSSVSSVPAASESASSIATLYIHVRSRQEYSASSYAQEVLIYRADISPSRISYNHTDQSILLGYEYFWLCIAS